MPGTINSSTVSSLFSNYTFEAIPESQAATDAGYTAADRAAAQIWFPPIIDGDKFYYGCWNGNATSLTHLSTIICCRKCSDGALVWASNSGAYALDTAPNVLGDTSNVLRTQPFILDNTLYLTRANLSNIGPQLYAVNKNTGALKWAVGYYPPTSDPAFPIPSFITTRADYSYYTGSNMRLGDAPPIAAHVNVNGVDKKYVFVGVSSFQNNWNLNYGIFGFPYYTDQGQLFCIEDKETTAAPVWSVNACAPQLNVGDTIVKGGNPAFDPFASNQNYVSFVSLSTSTNYFVQPYFVSDPPSPAPANTTPVAAVVNFDSTTVINASLIQPLWGLLGKNIYEDNDRTTTYNLSGLLSSWIAEQSNLPPDGTSVRHVIWAFVTSKQVKSIAAQAGNEGVMYFKYLNSGQTITEPMDAQGLNYWGNSLWAGRPCLDLDRNLVYFGTGQAHAIPLAESLFYQQPDNNFLELKKPVIDTINKYIAGTAKLNKVTNAKKKFIRQIKALSLDVKDKSPRGRMSYSDAIMGAYIVPYTNSKGQVVPGGTKAFGVRIIPCDSYTFLSSSPSVVVYPLNDLDGDASSGVKLFNNGCGDIYLSTCPKSGLVPIVDVSNINPNVLFDDNNLARKGVDLTALVYGGPNSSGGGSSYLDDSTSTSLICTQSNISGIVDGSVGSDGTPECHVTTDGRVFPIGDSFVESVSIPDGDLIWETDLNEIATGEIVVRNNVAYTESYAGSLYALSASNGNILWHADGTPLGLNGGNVGPAVSDKQVIWINNYVAFGSGSAGPNGASFVVPGSTTSTSNVVEEGITTPISPQTSSTTGSSTSSTSSASSSTSSSTSSSSSSSTRSSTTSSTSTSNKFATKMMNQNIQNKQSVQQIQKSVVKPVQKSVVASSSTSCPITATAKLPSQKHSVSNIRPNPYLRR